MRIGFKNVVFAILALGLFPAFVFAGPTPTPKPETPMTASALTYAVNFARMNPQVSVDQKKAVARKAFEFIRSRAAKNLDLKSPEDLYREFATHPDLMKNWNKTSDGKQIKDPQLGKLISEFNLLIAQLNVEKTLGKCKDFKRNLGPTLMEGTCSVCGCREGFGWDKNIYITWTAKDNSKNPKSKSKTKLTEPPKYKEYRGWMPGFAFGKNIESLIAVSDIASYFASDARPGDPFAPTLDELKSKVPAAKTPEDLASYAMMAEFRGNVYKRTMMASIESQLVNEIQYSDKYLGKSPDEIYSIAVKRVDEEVTKQCQHCSVSGNIDKDIRNSLKNIMKSNVNSGSALPVQSSSVAAELCSNLKEAKYTFDPAYKSALDRAYLSGNGGKAPKGGLHNSQFDNASNAYTAAKLQLDRERRKTLSAISQSSSAGKLMLTKAMTSLDGTNPGSTKLQCVPGSEKADAALILKAQEEAADAGNKFTKKVNDNVHPNDYSLKTFNEDLTTLLKIAPHPFGQAVLLSSSSGAAAKFACDLIQSVSDKDLAEAYLDDAILWGGIGLSLLSLGTLAPLSMAGLAANAAIGIGTAAYSVVQANQAEQRANNYRIWSIAQDFDPYLKEMSQKEYDRYNTMVTSAVVGFGFTVFDVNAMIMKWIAKGDTMAKALSKAEDLLKQPPEKIYTEVLSTEAEVAIGGGRVITKQEGKALYQAANAADAKAAQTILKEAGFAEGEIPKILAKRFKEEAEVVVEKQIVKEMDGVVVTAPKRDIPKVEITEGPTKFDIPENRWSEHIDTRNFKTTRPVEGLGPVPLLDGGMHTEESFAAYLKSTRESLDKLESPANLAKIRQRTGNKGVEQALEKIKNYRAYLDAAEKNAYKLSNDVRVVMMPDELLLQSKGMHNAAEKGLVYCETGACGKTLFPASWSEQKIKDAIKAVAEKGKESTRGYFRGVVDGVEIEVEVKNGIISSGYPVLNPKQMREMRERVKNIVSGVDENAPLVLKQPITGSRTEFGPNLGRDLFKPGEVDEILKTSGVEGLQKELDKIGLKTKKIKLEREVTIDGQTVTKKYDALMLDPSLFTESNLTSNHLVNYLKRSQKLAGPDAPGVEVIFRLDDNGIPGLGEFSQAGKVKEVTLSKKVLEDYLKTGNAGPLIKHEYRHYLLYNKASAANSDLQIVFEGAPVAGYEDRLVMHEYYNYHRQAWDEFATQDVREAQAKIFKRLNEKETMDVADLGLLTREQGALNSAALRSKQAVTRAKQMDEFMIDFVQEYRKLNSGLRSDAVVISPTKYGVTVEVKIRGKWVSADFPCNSCSLLKNDLNPSTKAAIEKKIADEVTGRLNNLYARSMKERDLIKELETVEEKIQSHLFSSRSIPSKELKDLYKKQETLRLQISNEVAANPNQAVGVVRTAGATPNRLVDYTNNPKVKNWILKEVAPDPQKAAAWGRFENRVSGMNLTPAQKKNLVDDAFLAHNGGKTGTYSKDKAITEFKLKLQDPKNPYGLSAEEAKTISYDLGDNWVLGTKPEGIQKVDFSANYFGKTNILATETQPDRVNAFRDAFMRGKVTRDMKITYQLGRGGEWETAYIVAYDKAKGLVKVRIGNDIRNTAILDEYQIMTAKEIPSANGSFDSKVFKGERYSFEPETEVVVERAPAKENTIKVTSEDRKTNASNPNPTNSEMKTGTGSYPMTTKQQNAYNTWKIEKAKNHPGISGLNSGNVDVIYMNETGKAYLKKQDVIDLIKVRGVDGQVVEFKNAVFVNRTGLFLKIEVNGELKTLYWREVMQLDGKGSSIQYVDPKPFQLQ